VVSILLVVPVLWQFFSFFDVVEPIGLIEKKYPGRYAFLDKYFAQIIFDFLAGFMINVFVVIEKVLAGKFVWKIP